ncbi:MAG: protein kinase [Planctomycetes bacterium]|nr:protein kinase [Planctomycetota bacterium]
MKPTRDELGKGVTPPVLPARKRPAALRRGQRLGKYRIRRRLAEGGFAYVYEATDTVEGLRVALKVPRPELVSDEVLKMFQLEARLHARLDHPNILPIKNADVVDGRLVIAYPMGVESLADRLKRRTSLATKLDFVEQMLAAVAHAHEHRIVHRDLKPDNFILFEDGALRLTDFGVSKIAFKTLVASGSGTVGHMAPEQAMGEASLRSDVFALGLAIWELFTGELPTWPFAWPPAGVEKLRGVAPPEFLALLHRALEVQARKRFADAGAMLAAFRRARPRFDASRRAGARGKAKVKLKTTKHWREVRFRQFLRDHKQALQLDRECAHCKGPLSEAMTHCPWCGRGQKKLHGASGFPATCKRCGRGRKLDWRFCAWCYGPGFDDVSGRSYSDKRYVAHCAHCRGSLLAFSRYCPWCHRKQTRKWKVVGLAKRCRGCGWGVPGDEWAFCAWCGKPKPGGRA